MQTKSKTAKQPELRQKYGLDRVDKATFASNPERYEFRQNDLNAPPCPYGNRFEWIGFDKATNAYVRFTKSVLKDSRLQKVV